MNKIFASGILKELVDPIPDYILKHIVCAKLDSGLIWIHATQNEVDGFFCIRRNLYHSTTNKTAP